MTHPTYPTPRTATWTARDFRFHTGETMPEVRLAYTTVGDPAGEPVLVLHGTTGSAANMLTPAFAGELFGAGQPLDATRYFIVLPDALGAGKSSRPSDGLRTRFPRYTYDDMVEAQHRLVTEGLSIRHLRLVLGNSMGGMHAWTWGTRYPPFMDALVPMAAQPTAMSSRNWLMRRMIIDAVRNDPAWDGGNYTTQPPAARIASVFHGIATNGGTIAWQRLAPTRAAAEAILEERLAEPFTADANDLLYLWEASRDYDPEPLLDRIEAKVLAIVSADDERNPHETGLMQRAMVRIRDGRLHLIPASEATRGHATTAMARLWKGELARLLAETPRRSHS
ncbi:MAG: alpha/beta fold hydrolase [Hyphomicrobiaceae bacterium]|nr:alpha/beta fold hydrolase [Hyphomicrobiaceae bacterium]